MAAIGEPGSSLNQTAEFGTSPLGDTGWDRLLNTHPRSCFFHGSSWARVLQETYGHRPTYFCNIVDGKLLGLLPVMEVSNRLIGVRGVSLPFTDYCHPLFADGESDWNPYDLAVRRGQAQRWHYLECRGCSQRWKGASTSLSFYGHCLGLQERPEELLKGFKPAVRRGISRAQASNLRIEFSQSAEAMRTFYPLHCLARRRHGLPPQPFRFFESITRHVLENDQGVVVLAFTGKRAVAGAVFFYRGEQAIFKFGASDYAFQKMRPNNLVMWEGIKWCQRRGLKRLHLGRTSVGNAGLRRFKLGFGANEERIDYSRYDFKKRAFVTDRDRSSGYLNPVFSRLPVPVLRLSGNLLYPYLG